MSDVTAGWRAYDRDDEIALARTGSLGPGPERECPACHRIGVRNYRYFSSRITSLTIVLYEWCTHCHRYRGITAPRPPALQLDEPVSPARRAELGKQIRPFLDHLNALWERGILPQGSTW